MLLRPALPGREEGGKGGTRPTRYFQYRGGSVDGRVQALGRAAPKTVSGSRLTLVGSDGKVLENGRA